MHDLFYKYLIDSFSEDLAKQYLYANQEAITNIKSIIEDEHIDCDFEIKDNYIFTESLDEVQKIKEEVSAISSLGIDAEFVTESGLPLDILRSYKAKKPGTISSKKICIRLMQFHN